MKWSEIKKQYPDSFILMDNIVEEKISENKSRLLEGNIVQVSQNPKTIRLLYQEYKQKGIEVLYTLPSTPENFIIENVPFMSITR